MHLPPSDRDTLVRRPSSSSNREKLDRRAQICVEFKPPESSTAEQQQQLRYSAPESCATYTAVVIAGDDVAGDAAAVIVALGRRR
mmetsp:Transcript_4780/g.14252  ORF Transcript_4780/g.14252 Transcript_4780/m.14252 type:complete len:85 (-) Transcript_4780:78-332(-)